MVRFVEDEHRAGSVLVEPIPKGRGILFIAQEGVGYDELRMGGPGVDCVSAFAAAVEEIVSVENHEAQAEASLHFALPLVTREAGHAMTMRFTFWRMIISRRMRPASMVLPRPTSSAMNRFTRGIWRAFFSGSS